MGKKYKGIAQVTFNHDIKRLYEFYVEEDVDLKFNTRYYIKADSGFEYNKSIQVINFVDKKEYSGALSTIIEAVEKE